MASGKYVSDHEKQPSIVERVRVKEGFMLRQKEIFEYVTPHRVYDVELYTNHDGTCYAIGIPRDTDRTVVYGSSMVSSPEFAIQQLMGKIEREGVDVMFDDEAGAGVSPDGSEDELDGADDEDDDD